MKKLNIVLRTNSPLFIADGSAAAHVVSDGRIIKKVPNKTPITRTEQKKIAVPASEAEGLVFQVVPYIKGNNFKGRIRSQAAEIIKEAVASKGKQITAATYRGLYSAASTGTPSKVEPKLSDITGARDHVYMGFLGGGNQIYKSYSKFSDLDLVHSDFIAAGYQSEDLSHAAITGGYGALTEARSLVRRDKMAEMTDPQMVNVVEGGEKAVADWIELAGSAIDEDSAVSRNMLKNKVAFEVAAQGLVYAGTIDVSELNEAQMGFAIECIARFAKKNEIGGKVSQGYGRFDLQVTDENGNEVLNSQNGVVDVLADDRYMDAMETALNELDLDLLNGYFA